MVKFLGCAKADPLAITRAGSNPVAFALVKKSKEPAAADPNPESSEMMTAAEVAKILSMTDVTKAHYLALPETEQTAFLTKTADEMNKIAADAKKSADDAAAAAAAADAGRTAVDSEVQKSLTDKDAQIAALTKRLDTADIRKRAETEFDGYPGGADVVVPMLESFATLPEAVRKTSEDALKSVAKAALQSGQTLAARKSNDQAAAATQEIEAEVEKRLTADPKKSRVQATAEVLKSDDLLLAGLAAEKAAH
jgi:hypothetical protein